MSPDPFSLVATEQAHNAAPRTVAESGLAVALVGAARLDLAMEHLLKAVVDPALITTWTVEALPSRR